MKRKALIKAIILCIIVPFTSMPASPQAAGRLKGTVTTLVDSSEAVVPKVKVMVESRSKKYEIVTDEEGKYEIELPAGTYTITTSSPSFCPYERAAFRMQPSTVLIINPLLVVCPLANILKFDSKGRYAGEECRYEDPFKKASFGLPNSSLHLLIRFANAQESKGIIEYQGGRINNGDVLGAIASYDRLTIYADRMRLNRATLLLEAEGNVIIEDGNEKSRAKEARIDFRAKDPIATLIKR